MGQIRIIVAAISILTFTGCAVQDSVLRKQAELESRVESLAVGSNLTNQRLSVLTNKVNDLEKQGKVDAATLRELRESILNLRERTYPMSVKTVPPPTPQASEKIELINKDNEGSPRRKSDIAAEAYMKAFGFYSANKYEEAITAFSSFIKKYPDSEYAANARYWIGECYYSRSNLPKALKAFNKVITDYPRGNKIPDAMLKVGYTLFAMKQPESATAMLKALIAKYPDNPAAVKARERLLKQL